MSTKLNAYLKVMPDGRTLIIMLIVILAIAVTTAFAWMQTDHIIAPPSLRVADWLWREWSANVPSRISSELYMRALSGLV